MRLTSSGERLAIRSFNSHWTTATTRLSRLVIVLTVMERQEGGSRVVVPTGGASQAGLGNPWKEGAPLTPEELPFLRFDAEAQESAGRTAQFQPAARARRFFCFFLRAARLRAVFLRFFTRMAVSYLRRTKSSAGIAVPNPRRRHDTV
jgi:hypothetical protein